MKKLIKIFLFGVLLFLILGVASYLMLQRYLNSPEFPARLSEMASKELKGDVEISDFTLDGRQVRSSQITLKNSGKINEVRIDGFETSFGKWAILKRNWSMQTLECDKLHVHIARKKKSGLMVNPKPKAKPQPKSQPKAKPKPKEKRQENASKAPQKARPSAQEKPVVRRVPAEKKNDPKKPKEKKTPFYEAIIPNKIEFNKLQVLKFSGLVERKNNDHLTWDNVEMNGLFKNETIQMTLTGGTLHVPLEVLPEWELIKAEVIANEETYEVKDADFTLRNGGTATINGGGKLEGGDISATAILKGIPIESFFKKPNPHAQITGLINGEVKVVSENDQTITKGTLVLNEGTLTLPKLAQPILRMIEIKGDNKLKLDQCTAEVTHVGDKTIFRKLDLSISNSYRVRGSGQLNGDQYTLRCQLGISPKLHGRLPDSLADKYTQRGSFYWIPVNQTGDKDNLAMDLSKKTAAALTKGISSKLLDKVGGSLGDEVKDFLESEEGDKLKEKGLKALEDLFR